MSKRKLFFLILIFLVLATLVFSFVYWLRNMKTEPEIPTFISLPKPTASAGGGEGGGVGFIKKP